MVDENNFCNIQYPQNKNVNISFRKGQFSEIYQVDSLPPVPSFGYALTSTCYASPKSCHALYHDADLRHNQNAISRERSLEQKQAQYAKHIWIIECLIWFTNVSGW